MKVNIDGLFDFDEMVGFWGCAKDKWDSYTEAEQEYLDELAQQCEWDSLTQINDFIWFDANDILEEWHTENADKAEDDDAFEV